MPVLVTCSNADCGKALRAKPELAGKMVKCPGCGTPMRVPAQTGKPSPAPPEPVDEERPARKASPPPRRRAADDMPEPVDEERSARKSSPPPRRRPADDTPDSDDDERPARKSAPSRRESADAPPVLSLPKLVLRPKRGLFTTDLDILDPETKEPVAVAQDRTKKLFGLFKVNLFGWTNSERWEIREDAAGPLLFLIRITKEHGFVSGNLDGIQCDVLDREEAVLASFRYDVKGMVKKRWQLNLLNAREEVIGMVGAESGKVMAGQAPAVKLYSPDGDDYGSITYKGIADAVAMMKEMKAQGKKFGMVSQFGEAGLELSVAPEVVGNAKIHRALLALAVLVEVTKIGKAQTGARN